VPYRVDEQDVILGVPLETHRRSLATEVQQITGGKQRPDPNRSGVAGRDDTEPSDMEGTGPGGEIHREILEAG
jgi:hypothetical protein